MEQETDLWLKFEDTEGATITLLKLETKTLW